VYGIAVRSPLGIFPRDSSLLICSTGPSFSTRGHCLCTAERRVGDSWGPQENLMTPGERPEG